MRIFKVFLISLLISIFPGPTLGFVVFWLLTKDSTAIDTGAGMGGLALLWLVPIVAFAVLTTVFIVLWITRKDIRIRYILLVLIIDIAIVYGWFMWNQRDRNPVKLGQYDFVYYPTEIWTYKSRQYMKPSPTQEASLIQRYECVVPRLDKKNEMQLALVEWSGFGPILSYHNSGIPVQFPYPTKNIDGQLVTLVRDPDKSRYNDVYFAYKPNSTNLDIYFRAANQDWHLATFFHCIYPDINYGDNYLISDSDKIKAIEEGFRIVSSLK